MLHFLGGSVAAERLAVTMQLERTYRFAHTSDKVTVRLPGTGSLITVFGSNACLTL
jgi:hypothetical protein